MVFAGQWCFGVAIKPSDSLCGAASHGAVKITSKDLDAVSQGGYTREIKEIFNH